MITTYKDYLINVINLNLETYTDNKREERLKNMLIEIDSTDNLDKLNHLGEQLEYLVSITKQYSY